MVDEMMDRFSKRAPVAVMFRSVFARLLSDQKLDELFAEHSSRQVESTLLFSTLVKLLTPVVSGATKSVNASYQDSDCEVSSQAVYDKLKGVEPEVSASLVRNTVDELRRIQDKSKTLHDDVIEGYHTFVVDGKTYNGTEHRLKESRRDARAPLPGRAIALLDTRYELFVDIECDSNPYRCERKIFQRMFGRLEKGALYLADRNFSDSNILTAIFKAEAFFVIRQHGACPSWRETNKKPKQFKRTDSNQGVVSEQEIEIKLSDGSWKRVRRITVELKEATRKGDTKLHLLTNLPSDVIAAKISDAYRKRWTIETCLGHLSQSLNAEIKTLAYPGAAGLCFCLALTLFNMMSTIKSHLRKSGIQPEGKKYEPSYYYMALEIAGAKVGLEIATDDSSWERFATMTTAKFSQFFQETAAYAKMKRYRKHTRATKKPKPKRKYTGSRHVASQALINQRK